jgi:hypothetical protein
MVVLKTDATISTGVALVPRSMGLPIHGPMEASVKVPKKAAAR